MAPALRTPTAVVAAAVVFAGLAVIAHRAGNGTALDHRVLEWLVHHRDAVLTRWAIIITDLGSPVGVAVLALTVCAVWWWRSRSLRPAMVIAAATLSAGALSTATKLLVDAHRPASSLQLVVETDASFPSGHVTGTVALLGSIAALLARQSGALVRRIAVATTIFVGVAVALTRIYLGVHWLTDVVGGLVLGGTVAVVTHALSARGAPRDGVDGPGGDGTSIEAPATPMTS